MAATGTSSAAAFWPCVEKAVAAARRNCLRERCIPHWQQGLFFVQVFGVLQVDSRRHRVISPTILLQLHNLGISRWFVRSVRSGIVQFRAFGPDGSALRRGCGQPVVRCGFAVACSGSVCGYDGT